MHWITTPEPVPLRNFLDGEGEPLKLSLPEFVRDTLATNRLWRQPVWIVNLQDVVRACEGKQPGDVIGLEDEPWEQLKTVTQQHDIDPRCAADVAPLIEAIVTAPKKKPAAPKPEGTEKPAEPAGTTS